MENEKNINEPENFGGFKGYTLEELKHQMALTLIKKEIRKERAMQEVNAIKKSLPFGSESPMANFKAKGLVGKLMKGLNYTDYIMLGFSMFNIGRKIFSLFRKKH